MIELRDVTLRYGDRTVLERCSLAVAPGAHAALMGPSGCGKTSLLRLVLGLERPRSGSVQVRGSVSCVFQEPRLLPWRTAAENVNAVLSDGPGTMDAARHWLAQVDLGEAADRYPAQMSGGMQQRLAIARALAHGGDVLLLDEPLKGCDEALRERLLTLLAAHSVGRTLLLVTHDAAEAAALAQQVYRFHGGGFYVM